MKNPRNRALLLFAVVFALLLWIQAPRLQYTNDEGIILEAAQRMLNGQKLYVDFFGYMSPGSYWIQEAVFRLFGVNQLAARLPVLFDLAATTALLYCLVTRLAASQLAAGVAAFTYFAFEFTMPGMLTAQHRWDSAALSLAAIAAALDAGERRAVWALSGALLAAATLCTPSIGLLAAVTSLWLLATKRFQPAMYFAGSGIAVAAVAAAVLASQGILGAFFEQLAWLQKNYSDVNSMPYGSIPGGYARLIESESAAQTAVFVVFAFFIAIAAIVPVATAASWSAAFAFAKKLPAPKSTIAWLLACTAAYVVTAYPRPDVMHLAFVAALPTALTATAICLYAPKPAQISVSLFTGLGAFLFLLQPATEIANSVSFATPAGTLRGLPSHRDEIAALVRRVQPSHSLYIHPYMPDLYFLTQARNPTRFSYLSPGMMTEREESMAIEDLERNSPRYILHMDLPRSEFMRIFPRAGHLHHKFDRLESWIAKRYEPVAGQPMVAGYRLMHAKDAAVISSLVRDR